MSWSPKVAQLIADLDYWLGVQVLQRALSVDERKEFARAIREYLGPLPDAAKLEEDCTVGAGVPSRSYTREVAAIQAALAHGSSRSAVDIITETCTTCGGAPCRCLARLQGTPAVVHILSQQGQPYGSERRCCNHCGIMLGGLGGPIFIDEDWSMWRNHPNNCGKER
jgi:hypothetical protein